MSIDLVALKKKFEEHIASMSDEEIMESARKAAEMTAGCDDDWPDDLIQVVRCKDCAKRKTLQCPMCKEETDIDFHARYTYIDDKTVDDGYCNFGTNKTNI